MRHHFQAEQWVPYSRERVFAFFADPRNLPPLMPGWQHARVEKIAGATGSVAGKGAVITISFRPLALVPLRLKWEACIVEFEWNEFFCDEQRRGPFRFFRHCHRIREEVREGMSGSVISDAVEYEVPLGPLGDIANALAVGRQIKSLFAYRQKMLLKLLAQDSLF